MIRRQILFCQSILATILRLTLASSVLAQSPATGQLVGTVTDQTGGVIVGASVTLHSGAQTLTMTTNLNGLYVFDQLQPGRYTLKVAYPGFEDFAAQVDVRPLLATPHDVRLKVEVVAVAVDVNEWQGLSTDPRKNLSGLVLTAQQIALLPDDTERLLQRMLEMAGSTGRPDDVAVFVDGFREYRRLPPKSAIDMIRINSNPFSAEFTQPGRHRIEITTKPGSDRFQGEVATQGGGSLLDSRNPLATTEPGTRHWNYHGYLQGPIRKGLVDFTAYAGQWKQDYNTVLRGTRVDPVTTADQPFALAYSTPTDITSVMVGTNFKLFNQRISMSYTRNRETRRNHGLEPFDLPERAYDRSLSDQTGRLWWTAMGQRFLNDVRVELTRRRADATARLSEPAVLVLDGFNAGGNQDVVARTSTNGLQATETLTLQHGRHLLKAGVQIERSGYDSTDRAGFGGTFIFGADVERDAFGNPVLGRAGQVTAISPIENYRRTLLGLPGYTPSKFWIVRGDPDVGVDQWNAGWFFLDDWSFADRLSLSYGIRQDFQNNLTWRANLLNPRASLSPRAALSWLLDAEGKNAIKLGAGMFATRVEPAITLETRRVNGIDRQQLIIERPLGFPSLPASVDVTMPIQSAIYTKSADLMQPYSTMVTAAYERQLPWGLFALGEYTYARGTHLLRLRNVGRTTPILQFESTGRSLQHQGMLALRGNISRGVTIYTNYVYAKKYSDTDSAYTTPANSNDLSLEYGLAGDDRRHQFATGATARLPHGVSVATSLTVASGRPFNITTGRDNNGDTVFSDRPAFADAADTGAIETAYGWLNPNPRPGDIVIPRNFGHESRVVSLNLSASKSTVEDLIVMIDIDNLLNTARFIRSNGVLTSPTFGLPNQALDGRRVVLTLRYFF